MAHNPLEQFTIKKIVEIEMFGYDISLTNSALFMMLAASFIVIYFTIAFNAKRLIPSKLQLSGEIIHTMISDMLEQNVGTKGRAFVPLIFTIFLFILTCNLFGLLPYGFTVTSHISVTFFIAMMVFLLISFVGFYLHGLRFFSLLVPSGTPLWLAPLMIVIELFTYLARPVSLSLRLTANMIAGHVLLKVVAGFVISMALYLKFIPIPFIIILVGFEIFVAILQAYIFAILSCVYLNDAVNLH